MLIEVIVQNKKEAIKAEQIGIDRIELVSEINKDGLTPKVEVVKEILDSVTIPVQIMIRPHDHGFYYDHKDVLAIKNTVKEMVGMGVTNFVFGALAEEDTIDESVLDEILSISSDIRLTFHRAFDFTRDLDEAYDILCKYSPAVERVLTSGGETDCMKGKDMLKQLVEKSRKVDGPIIMPGSGLNAINFPQLREDVQAKEYHFGKGVRQNESYQDDIDIEIVADLKQE